MQDDGPRAADPPGHVSLSLVIPAYNEEERLPGLLEGLRAGANAAAEASGIELLEVFVVDDGSSDGSRRILAEAAKDDERLQAVFAYEENRGKGAAAAAGVARARGDYVLLADADLSTPLDELPKLVEALRNGADVAVGSRHVPGAVVDRGPLSRKLTGGAFSGVVRVLTGLRVRDTQNGFKLFRTEDAQRLLAEQICPGFAFDVELLMRADRSGLRIAEVPVVYLHDARSSVHIASASAEMLRDVVVLAWRLRLRERASSAGGTPAPGGAVPRARRSRDPS